MSQGNGQIEQSQAVPVHDRVKNVTVGTMICKRWHLKGTLGRGTYGIVYSASDNDKKSLVAIKVGNEQKKSKSNLLVETDVLKQLQGSRYVARYIDSGVENDVRYLVMSILGTDLGKILKRLPTGRFSCSDAAHLSVQLLPAIKAVHDEGYVHRDIKPSNFALYSSHNPNPIIILDFGAVRKFRDKDGKIIEPRSVVNFTGNPLYASPHALSGFNEKQTPIGSEQCRKDDLWSMLFVIVSFYVGSLPWTNADDWQSLILTKCQTPRNLLLCGLRNELYRFYDSLVKLKYGDEPNYVHLQGLLDNIHQGYTVVGNDGGYDFQKQTPNSSDSNSSE